ncbi:Uncharacterised protein [Bordetella pertussis]|nr:Uncharacterised protein [Bordetella pertussis]
MPKKSKYADVLFSILIVFLSVNEVFPGVPAGLASAFSRAGAASGKSSNGAAWRVIGACPPGRAGQPRDRAARPGKSLG